MHKSMKKHTNPGLWIMDLGFMYTYSMTHVAAIYVLLDCDGIPYSSNTACIG